MFAASKTASVSGGYQISRSLRFNNPDSTYLTRTPASASNRKTWTYSAWVKRSGLASYPNIFNANDNAMFFRFNGDDTLNFGVTGSSLQTNALYRDPSAWYHFIVAVDTTQATSTNRVKLYVNGTQITVFNSATYPTQNFDTDVNTTNAHRIGVATTGDAASYLSGYMTEINFVDGTQLTPSSFGATDAQTGVWSPIAYSGSYGTNGFYLNFSDNSNTTAATLGKDNSGNGNNWTPNNFSVTAGAGNDSLVDSPTSYGTTDTGVGGEIRGNYCTLNPLYKNGAGTPAITNGNLDMLAGGTGDSYFGGTFSVSSGKWYYECLINAVGTGGTSILIGICKTSAPNGVNIGSYRSTSEIYNLDGTTQTAGATYAAGDTIGVAIDIDAGTVKFYKNNTGQGATPSFTFTAGTEVFVRGRSDSANPSATFNFGQRPFLYTAPSGFKALCTQNLPTPTIGATTATQASQYFAPVIYSGDGTTGRSIAVGFQPDFTWIKTRSPADWHVLDDSVRGAGKIMASNSTQAEVTDTTAFNAFNSNGFVVGTSAGWHTNRTGGTYVAWNWKGNGSGSTNTSGSITSTVSANTTSGFSIVTYTGTGANATVGHGLGVAPKMIIVKTRATANDWYVYNENVGNTKYLRLNTIEAAGTFNLWQNTSPTSSVFYLATDGTVNGNGGTYVAYCFAAVAGFSAFGSYTGNGSSDGPFIYTGFRPAYLLIKFQTGTTSWMVLDNPRSSYFNVAKNKLYPDTTDAEATDAENGVDLVSNGFKIRTGNNKSNDPGATYIYVAFAENPFKYSLAR